MSSKIENYGPQGPAAAARARQATAAQPNASTGKPAVPVAAGESVKLTGEAQLLAQTGKAASAAPDVDMKKVSEIRDKVRDGRYQVNAERVAAKLTRYEWELGSR
ncbi:flagellar biosynthesis anti-sigma factor FlgM [Solimonas sp. K1W22B-7]|uniref:flagellar biosynthesis anti-sigma factor FlgM n=1 Tax=Solimonas sp. K1W22B-7 TaxID=2303331 RepID=UPI000E337D94|nr:flagellar biosynthesis anti-sigma factor FlgM [Solimonas sp. K1W22B-7]AXQ30410.1 flagellar biosynthesis anti-sigma factor FlgM [Solimonas sp. K1W22B-7]